VGVAEGPIRRMVALLDSLTHLFSARLRGPERGRCPVTGHLPERYSSRVPAEGCPCSLGAGTA
jgi:hypothetical protein